MDILRAPEEEVVGSGSWHGETIGERREDDILSLVYPGEFLWLCNSWRVGSADRAGTPCESNGQMMIDSAEKWRLVSIDLELGSSGEQYMT